MQLHRPLHRVREVPIAERAVLRHHQHASIIRCSSQEQPRPASPWPKVPPSMQPTDGTGARAPITPPKPRIKPAGPPPEPIPVRHSTAFILEQRKQDGQPDDPAAKTALRRQSSANEAPFTGNAVQYWLKKADESLDEIEEKPTETAKALYQVSSTVSKSPVGTATAKGVELVAKLGLMAGKEAVKVAVPAAGQVAKWAMTQGAKAAMGAVSGAVSNSVRAGLSGGEGSGGKDKGGNGGGSAGGNVGGSVGGPVQGEKQGVAEGRNGTG